MLLSVNDNFDIAYTKKEDDGGGGDNCLQGGDTVWNEYTVKLLAVVNDAGSITILQWLLQWYGIGVVCYFIANSKNCSTIMAVAVMWLKRRIQSKVEYTVILAIHNMISIWR